MLWKHPTNIPRPQQQPAPTFRYNARPITLLTGRRLIAQRYVLAARATRMLALPALPALLISSKTKRAVWTSTPHREHTGDIQLCIRP